MGPTLEAFVVAMNSVTLVCGGLVTLYAVRAYRRTHARALGSLAVGLAFVTTGALLAGGLHQLTGLDFATGVGVQSAFTAVGFAVLAYSLYARWERPESQSSM
ncbi:MAG: DUF7521 family protein [Halapricum sp.]